MSALLEPKELTTEEVVSLGGVDTAFFNQHFFPRAFRTPAPSFHRGMLEKLDRQPRLFAAKVFRGGAKTTLLRAFAAKRISYGLTTLAFIVSETQEHSLFTVNWLKTAVEHNSLWTQTFGLRKGAKWGEEEIEIIHGQMDLRIRVMAKGITGQVRGFNFDDYRPDLILLDDVCNEENTRTTESRRKLEDLIMGALVNSLRAPGDCPHAMLAMAQTPLNEEDAIEKACKDPSWVSVSYGCFDEKGESRWPEMFPTEYLIQKKKEAMRKNQLSLWMREMECVITSRETALFRKDWIQFWNVLPEGGFYIIGLDPTPPAKENKPITYDRDDAAIVLWYICNGNRYLVDYYITKSPSMEEFSAKFFELAYRAVPLQSVVVETVGYQRVLKDFIQKEMLRRNLFYTILPYEDKRKKADRINQSISNTASNRRLFIHEEHSEWLSQYLDYPDVAHDDLLDATAIAFSSLNPAVEGVTVDGDFTVHIPGQFKELPSTWRGAP